MGDDGPHATASSRVLIHPSDPQRSRDFYRNVLGLAVYREFGPADSPGPGVLPRAR